MVSTDLLGILAGGVRGDFRSVGETRTPEWPLPIDGIQSSPVTDAVCFSIMVGCSLISFWFGFSPRRFWEP